MDAVWVALIGSVTTILISWLTARNETKAQLAAMKEKLDFLWRVIVENAVVDAQKERLAQRNSPLSLGDRWEDIVPAKLMQEIRNDTIFYLDKLGSAYDASLEVFRAHEAGLMMIAREQEIKPAAILGALYALAHNLEGTA